MFLCSYDLGSRSCILVIWVYLLVYFYSNLMYFYVLNFVFTFFNFVKIILFFFKLDADIDANMVFIIIILPCQCLACHLRYFRRLTDGKDENNIH